VEYVLEEPSLGYIHGRVTDHVVIHFVGSTKGIVLNVREPLIWLPGVGDVLEMLVDRGIRPWLQAGRDGKWRADALTDVVPYPLGEYKPRREETPLIALMELLKAVGNG
jgi:hypothetical protein